MILIKCDSLLVLVVLCIGTFTSQSHAQGTFNPAPVVIQSPEEDAAIVLKRLTADSEGKTPTVKKIDPAWIKALGVRGEPTTYTKANSKNFAYIGMPIGGIGAGELYLGGDGRLWDWDIFNTRCTPNFPVELGLAYPSPHQMLDPKDDSQYVIDQGVVLRTSSGGKIDTRTLDRDGFSDVKFTGQYPIGYVDYSDPDCPVQVRLEAFSPYIPSNVEDSSYPATILNYTLTNNSKEPVECTIGGWLENAVAWKTRNDSEIVLQTKAVQGTGCTLVNYSASASTAPPPTDAQPPVVIDDFESGRYDNWTAEGTAFGPGPVKTGDITHAGPVTGVQGQYAVDSYFQGKDTGTGKLTSKPFVINRSYLNFLIGGGNQPGKECMNLLIDGKVVESATGSDSETLHPTAWDVQKYAGQTAQLEIVDNATGGWGHILIDNIVLADAQTPMSADILAKQPDMGTMTFALLGDPSTSEAVTQVDTQKSSAQTLDAAASESAQVTGRGTAAKLSSALRRKLTLAPGEKATVSFIISWHFPNPLAIGLHTSTKRQYTVRFKSSQDVVDHLVANFDRLTQATRLWHDTWYDSTLPYWFLDRTFLNASILATSTSYLFSDGRFYGYEGHYSCPGTCTHVWGYQQALGFLFPDLEKAVMEKVEFVPGLGMNAEGGIAMRAEFDSTPPVDGQSGIILRSYLAHRMSADNSFLTRNYASIKKATDFLIKNYDADNDGIMEGDQHNTMDAGWFGKITWLSLYYQAALRATAEMADAMNDADYAKKLRAIADKGRSYIEDKLFNGAYFIQEADPAHPNTPGTFQGCQIEQLMGQSWAYDVGLGEIVNHDKAITALNSIWTNNYTTDVGPYRAAFKAGRWLTMPGEGGILMCTFPQGGKDALDKGVPDFAAYNNECWTGSEYEETALMMWEGLVDKALAEVRTIEDRYNGAKRNPWNECECGSHYSRAMASYGVFVAASGFEYNGPTGTMAFAPRVSPEDFKAAFTSAEGWGSFSQKYQGNALDASLALRYGKLHLKSLALIIPPGNQGKNTKVSLAGKDVPISSSLMDNRLTINFTDGLNMTEEQNLEIAIQ